VDDGTTLQLGIGDVPDAALRQLGHRRNLGVWSEMISDGVLDLERRGALDRSRPVTCSFLFGSEELYEWSHANERLLLRRTEVTNDPAQIEARSRLVAVNAAIQVDLYAQANASYVRGRIYSGFGGQPDFVTGALHSKDGHAIIALRSWHEPSNSSRVIPLLESPTTSLQHSLLITEHGTAEIFGRTRREQVDQIIENIADPRAREWLRAEAVV
jgi:acyl-CoA hydrolase